MNKFNQKYMMMPERGRNDEPKCNLPSVACIACIRCKESHAIDTIEYKCFSDGHCQKCRAELSGKFCTGKSHINKPTHERTLGGAARASSLFKDTMQDAAKKIMYSTIAAHPLGRKQSVYQRDTSAYDTMDIYAICKVWNAEPSGCTHHALKKLLHAGERGVKSKITDLEQAIESIERLIALERL